MGFCNTVPAKHTVNSYAADYLNGFTQIRASKKSDMLKAIIKIATYALVIPPLVAYIVLLATNPKLPPSPSANIRRVKPLQKTVTLAEALASNQAKSIMGNAQNRAEREAIISLQSVNDKEEAAKYKEKVNKRTREQMQADLQARAEAQKSSEENDKRNAAAAAAASARSSNL